MLHIQTKQIKDDITLQLISDRENLATMANFASKLYADGKGYERMFDYFKPIGLFSRIGILNPDGTFITKDGTYDLKGKISFENILCWIATHTVAEKALFFTLSSPDIFAYPLTNRKKNSTIYML